MIDLSGLVVQRVIVTVRGNPALASVMAAHVAAFGGLALPVLSDEVNTFHFAVERLPRGVTGAGTVVDLSACYNASGDVITADAMTPTQYLWSMLSDYLPDDTIKAAKLRYDKFAAGYTRRKRDAIRGPQQSIFARGKKGAKGKLPPPASQESLF